jgi:diguanylate cyclase (GGDEF)-like protein
MLPRLVAQAARDNKPLSVAIVDFDHFKNYNDTLGHQAGDRLLRDAATAWARQLRQGDVLARYGGEEFAIALHDCTAEQALEVVNRVRSATPEGQTCSAGIATLANDEALHELIARADAALYQAKRDRNRTVLHR